MKKIYRIIKTVIGILILSSGFVSGSLAGDIIAPLTSVICDLYDVILYISGMIAGLVFVMAGVKWVGSMDDPGARKQAKDTMIHAIVGLIIVIIAKTLVEVILGSQPCR